MQCIQLVVQIIILYSLNLLSLLNSYDFLVRTPTAVAPWWAKIFLKFAGLNIILSI